MAAPDTMFQIHPACATITTENAAEGRVKCEPRRTKVAIVGFGTNTRSLVPWSNPEFEVWGMNQAYLHIPRRADRWFELHRPEHTPDMRDPEYLGWLKSLTIPCYMQTLHHDIPASVRFPVERLVKEFGLDYFTSSVAFMIALAISESFEEIHLYGIDLVTEEEYGAQKPCVEWWLGIAWGRGINVYIPPESALLKQPFRYGYEVAPAWGGVSPDVVLNEMQDYTKRQAQALAEYHTMNGVLQYAKRMYELLEAAQRGSVIATPGRAA